MRQPPGRPRDSGSGLRWVRLLTVSSLSSDQFWSSLFCPYRTLPRPRAGLRQQRTSSPSSYQFPPSEEEAYHRACDQPQGALARCFSRSNKQSSPAGPPETPPGKGRSQDATFAALVQPLSSVERTTPLPGQRALPGARQAPQQHQRFAEAPRGAAGRGLQAEPPQSAEQLLLHTARHGPLRGARP